MYNNDILREAYSKETIEKRVLELGEALSLDYFGKNPVLICILNGGFVFTADLARAMDIPLEIQFLKASSYGDASVSSGNVDIGDVLKVDIKNRHVLIVEDIVDTGATLRTLLQTLLRKKPASLKLCALLNKTGRRKVEVTVDYSGFLCEAEFFVGYGMDYAEKYRNLPYIGVLKPEIYSKRL